MGMTVYDSVYPAHLNATELIWARLKGYVARHNVAFQMADVRLLITDAIPPFINI